LPAVIVFAAMVLTGAGNHVRANGAHGNRKGAGVTRIQYADGIAYGAGGKENVHDFHPFGQYVNAEKETAWPKPANPLNDQGKPINRKAGPWHSYTQDDRPRGLFGSAMAWSKALGGVVLFGGTNNGMQTNSKTWLWKDHKWKLLYDKGPGPRSYAAMAWDSKRDMLVLFGGVDKHGAVLADTWELGADGWAKRTPPDKPTGRSKAAMAFDSKRGVTVLFGGRVSTEKKLTVWRDCWEWDGRNWSRVTTKHTPPGRYDCAMAYDEERGVVVFHGGTSGVGIEADQWVYDGKDWVEPEMDKSTSGKEHGMVYDVLSRRLVLITNEGIGEKRRLTTFWPTSWPTVHWEPDRLPRVAPRMRFSCAYDRGSNEIVVFGGRDEVSRKPLAVTLTCGSITPAEKNSVKEQQQKKRRSAPGWTWIDNGKMGAATWIERSVAWDTERGVAVMFGGTNRTGYNADTWEFSDGKWHKRTPKTSPPARASAIMYYDVKRKHVVIACGHVYDDQVRINLSDSWYWDGKDWTRITKTMPYKPLSIRSWAYDRKRARLIALCKPDDSVGDDLEIYEFDGRYWSEAEVGMPRKGIKGGKLVYDPRVEQVMLYGSSTTGDSKPVETTWHWNGTALKQTDDAANIKQLAVADHVFPDATRKGLWWLNRGNLTFYDAKGKHKLYHIPTYVGLRLREVPANGWVDEKTGLVYVHGGVSPVTNTNDTWSFDPAKGEELPKKDK
jgi:hypothetical protein